MKKILIVAGDTSGDLLAAKLVTSLRELNPGISVAGCGGDALQKVCDRFLGNLVLQHSFGFTISPKKLCYFRKILNTVIVPELQSNPPDVVIPVDFYGFNFHVSKLAKGHNRKVCYYVSPQFWASRPERAEKLRPFVDLFLCLFPFEMEFYSKRNIPAQFVGHPILDSIPPVPNNPPQPRVELTIGLLPGSRMGEIYRHLPVMMEACQLIANQHPATRFVLFTVPHISKDTYKQMLQKNHQGKLLVELVQDENYSWRSQLDLAISSSGMETLENALLGVPMVIMYKMNWLNYLLARCIVNTPYVGLPNVLAKNAIVPEHIQSAANPQSISKALLRWIENPAERTATRNKLISLRSLFGDGGASRRAAQAILEKVTA